MGLNDKIKQFRGCKETGANYVSKTADAIR